MRLWQRSSFSVCLLLNLFLFVSSWSFAQLSTASINGRITDPSGAVVPSATVVLRSIDTSVENTMVSNGSGDYALLSITPGRYTLKATAAGFSPAEVPAFTLTVSQLASIDFSLKVGTVASVVTIQSATPQLEVSSARLGTLISAQQVNELPLNGRNFTQLLSLTPGVSTANTGQNAGGGLSPYITDSAYLLPIINGQSDRSNFFLTDGLDANDVYYNGYTVPPIIDAIQEFKIVSHTDSAEFGSVLGGVINVVTKSGTNELHGSAWEHDRDQIFDARTYFLPTTTPKAPYHQSQFGGAIGGPVRTPKFYNGRDKTFFFGAYQGFRYSKTNDPRMVAYAQFLFPPAGPVLNAAGDNYVNTTPTIQTQDEFDVRVDQKIGANDSAFFRYSFINSTTHSSTTLPIIATNKTTPARAWGASYVHVFNLGLILQGQFSRTTLQYNPITLSTVPITNIFNQVGFAPAFSGNFTAANGRNLIPAPGISGYASTGETYETNPKTTDSYQESATLTNAVNEEMGLCAGSPPKDACTQSALITSQYL